MLPSQELSRVSCPVSLKHTPVPGTHMGPKLPLPMQESESEPEIVKGLSGDEVDTSNIVEGGRGRRGRAQSSAQMVEKYQQKAQDSDEDSW